MRGTACSALLSGRAQRDETARRALRAQLCGGVNCPPQVEAEHLPTIDYLDSVVDTAALNLPLGWHIPAESISALDKAVVPHRAGPEHRNGILLEKQQSRVCRR